MLTTKSWPSLQIVSLVSAFRFVTLMIVTTCAFCCVQQATADHFDCYILAGQSNMDGRGQNSDLTKDQKLAAKKAIIFYNNAPLASKGWEPLSPGFSRPPKFKGPLPSPKFGPEIGFAIEMGQIQPEQKIAIIKGSEGGTNLRSEWKAAISGDLKSQGRCYQNLMGTIKAATDQLKSEGHTYSIKAMLWHQGEADSKADPVTHQQRLTSLIARFRSDIEVADLPVVLGQVFDNGKRDKVRKAIRATASAVQDVGLVTAEGFTTWDEGTHFDAASQLLMGQRFAAEVVRLTDGEKKKR